MGIPGNLDVISYAERISSQTFQFSLVEMEQLLMLLHLRKILIEVCAVTRT